MEEIRMLRTGIKLLLAFFILMVPISVFAGSSDTTSASIYVQEINEIAINNASITLTVSSAVAGSQPNDATTTSSYNITTNCTANSKKITGAINSELPAGVALQVQVAAPSGAASEGYVSMGVSAQDVVTSIDATATSNLQIDFRLSADVTAGIIPIATRTLTLTLADAI